MFSIIPFFLVAPVDAAAPNPEKSLVIHLERDIDASAERTWEVLAKDFVGIDRWASGLESRELLVSQVPDGLTVDPEAPVPGRIVTSDQQANQIQVLVDFDADERTFTFESANPPKVFAYAHNQHTITDLGDGRSRVTIDVVIVPKGIAKLLKGKIRNKFTDYMEAYLDEAEAGITATVADGGVQ